ncbi:MAG: LPS O-antigen subunit length determinant protein (WzzB/FepE family) [Crocinitomicaceae bacterium]|jgi:LPS O-antigen subunit length determinant protein (WzzB/FepE family)
MSKQTNELDQERQNLLLFIWRKRKIIIIGTGIAMVVAIVVSLMIKPQFKSTAIVFPAATSTVSFSEQRNAKAAAMDFGEEDQAEQLVQILASSRVRNRIVQEYDLMKHYKIDKDDPNKNFKLGKAYDDHIQYTRTRYGSIQIDVTDPDREMAAEIANRIVDLIDTVKNEMVRERTIPAFEINKRKRDQLEFEKVKLQEHLDSLSQLGVVPTESRANLYQAYIDSKNAEDKAFFKEQMTINAMHGASYDGLQQQRDERIIKLTKFEDSYEQSESNANTNFNHKFVVELAVVADKKDKPKRMIIVLLATMGAFVFMIFVLLVKDRISELRKAA